MTLYIIGIGLCDGKDITLRGLEALKASKKVYMESYTSIMQVRLEDLEKSYGVSIAPLGRKSIESDSDKLIESSKSLDIAILVPGDPMCATTHISLVMRAGELGAKVGIIHNASIVSAIGAVGLEVYKYGRIISIPFHNKEVTAPVEAYRKNNSISLHTLFLLDLEPGKGRFLSISDAVQYLINQGIERTTLAVGCARIGSKDEKISVDNLGDIGTHEYGKPPFCLILPGKLHFMEEDALNAKRKFKY